MLRLRFVVDGEDRSVPLNGDKVRLGRGGDNDVVLSDVSVSRHHAELRRDTDGWSVFDLKSTNGVEVNRALVQRAPLQPGDRLGIGIFELVFEVVEPPLPPPGMLFRPVEAPRPPKPADSDAIAGLASLGNATLVRPLADFAALYGLEGKPAAAAASPASSHITTDQAYADRMFGFLTRLARILIVAVLY